MIRHTAKAPRGQTVALLLVLMMCGLSTAAFATPLAKIDILPMSPRTVTYGGNPIFTQNASGLHVVPIGNKVYLEAEPTTTALSGYKWLIVSKPSGSAAALSATTGTLITLTPDVVGSYQVAVVPLLANKSTTASVQLIRASKFIGAGVPNTYNSTPYTPNCAASYCHGGSNAVARLNVAPKWLNSGHATKMARHMSGVLGDRFPLSCLPCHNTGYDTTPGAVNGGFDDVAATLNYNLSQIPTLVAEAAATGLDKYGELPLGLQKLANIQCEACHGPGSQHPSNLQASDHGIAGADLEPNACARCHDAPTHHQIFWQWEQSTHPGTHTLEEGHVVNNAACSRCHSGDGFVANMKGGNLNNSLTGNKSVAYASEEDTLGATCSVCHDPHDSDYGHQLRVTGAYTYDNGDVYPGKTGLGGVCMRCHQGRVSSGQTTSVSKWRGIHGAAQSDMLGGVHAYTWGEPTTNSAHTNAVEESCVECHMAAPTDETVAEPPKVGGHTMALIDDKGTTDTADDVENVKNACGACHPAATVLNMTAKADYDGNGQVEGVQTEVKGIMNILATRILADNTSVTMDHESGKLLPVPSAKATSGDYLTTTYNKFSTDLKGALYNYNYVVSDASYGIHNTAYTIQILQRSYLKITGHTLAQDFPQAVLRNEAPDGKNNVDNWGVFNPVEMTTFSVD